MLSQETVEHIVEKFHRCISSFGVGDHRARITLELRKGIVSLLSIPQEKNVFSTSKYTFLNFFPTVIYDSFTRLQNIFYLAMSLIMLIEPYTLTPFYRWVIIFPLGFNILIYMFKEYMLNRNRWIQDDQINNQTTRRGVYEENIKGDGDVLEEVKWRDLQIGDVVYLTKGEIVPADIILLDSGQVREREALCMVDTQYTDGKSTLTKKRSSYLTQLIVTRTRQKNNFKEYRKMLTGKLEYEVPNANTEHFKATLKLKKDPKIEKLTIENFIPKGAKIRQTSWLFGLVVFTGMDTKMMMCSRYSTSKMDYYTKVSNLLTLLFLFMIAFFALISIIVLLSRSDDLGFLKQYDADAASGLKIFNLLVLYSQILPFGLFLMQDLIQLVCKYIIEREMITLYGQQFTKVNDSSTLTNLGQAEYMLLDKTGTLTTSYQKIDSILFGSNKYWVNHDNMFDSLTNPAKRGKTLEQEYHVNFEHEAGEVKQPRGMEFSLVNTVRPSDVRVVNSIQVNKPKKNEMLFSQGNRKPVPPTYVAYDQILNQPPNLSLTDLKEHLDNQEIENNHSQLNSNHNNHELKLQSSMRRSVFHKRNNTIGIELQDQSQEFVQLVGGYLEESPQDRFVRTHNENDILYDSFMKCMLLCHEARPVYLASKDTLYESFSKNEEVALQFAQCCGYALERFNRFDSPDEYFCRINKELVKYKVLGLNQFTYSRKLNSVVVQCPPSSDISIPHHSDYAGLRQLSGSGSEAGSILICKGDYEAMRDLLDINQKEREELESMLAFYKRRGVRMIIYATREMSEHVTEEYSGKFNLLKSSLTSQEDQLEKLAIAYEVNLNILGIVGFKEELKPDALDFIQTMKASHINCWLLSGDQEASTMSCAYALQLTDALSSKILNITRKSREKIFFEINNAVGLVQQEMNKNNISTSKQMPVQKPRSIKSSTTIYSDDNYNKMNIFTLCINGHSLTNILKHNELLSHFRFLCCICRTVIGYNLNPQQKRFMCAMVKNNFPNKPTVIAVGDGFNDALMMQEADVSIEVLNKGRKGKEYKPQVNAGDILVSSLTQIKDLVLTHGKQQSERTANVIYFLFYHSIFLGMTLFYFNWFCVFTATSMHDSMTIFLTNFFFMVPNCLILGLADEPTVREVNHYFPALYVDGQIRKKYYLLFFLLQSFIEGFLQAACVFYSTMFLVQYSTNEDGHASDLQMMSTIIVFSLLVAATFKLCFILLSRGIKSALLSQFLSLGFIVVFVIVNFRANFSNWDYMSLTYEIFTRFDSVMSLLFNLILCIFISFTINQVRGLLLPTVYEQFAYQNNEGKAWNAIRNSEILTQTVSKTIDVSAIVKLVFTGSMQISPYVQEMLNPGDTQVTEMKLKTLSCEMKELIMEKKFKSAKLENSINHYRFFFIILFLYFGVYALADYLANLQRQFTGYQYLILFVVMAIFIAFTFMPIFKRNYYLISHLIVAIIVSLKIAIDWLSEEFGIALSAQLLAIMGSINTTNMQVMPIIIYNVAYFLQFTARVITIGVNRSDTTVEGIYSIDRVTTYTVSTIVILSFCIVVLLLYLYYQGIKQRRNDFLARDQIEQDNNLAHDILSILVPKFVQQSISSGIYNLQEAQDDVAILFLYICDFDNIMKEEGKNVVPMLDSLFRVYDNLCLQHGVQKIETVGYTYMAASGIKACEAGVSGHILKTEKTVRLINLAHDMAKQVVGRKYGKGNQIEIKVGIHVGRVIAGVIGHHKPQFSLIGDPVNQTSRVGSTGDAGAITLSEQAFNKAKKDINYYTKKQKEAKGLGIINTFQVFQEKPPGFVPPLIQQRWMAAFKMVRAELKNNFKRDRTLGGQNRKFFDKLKRKQIEQNIQAEEILSKSHQDFNPMMRVPLSPNMQSNIRDSFKGNGQFELVPATAQEHPVNATEDDEILKEDEEQLAHEQKETIRPNRFLLTVPAEQNHIYMNFLNITKEKNSNSGRYKLSAQWFTYLILTLLLIIVRKLFSNGVIIFIMRAIYLGAILILFPLLEQAFSSNSINICYWITLQYASITTLVQAYFTSNQDITTISILELLYIVLVSCNLGIFGFLGTLLYLISVFGCFLGLYIGSDQISLYYVFYVFGAVVLTAIMSHQSLRENIEIFNNLQINEERKVKQLTLVSQLLPTHAFLKLRNSSIYNKQDLTDEFHEVTLLFADIKGFTEYSNSVTPEQVVLMLRNLFTEFDKKCQQFNVYKVYTIGDCYVVMGFTNSAKRNPIQEAINTINMGFAMIEIIRDVRRQIKFDKLDMRIGIHTGYVIGGIIGTDIVRYDIYGKDVSIANKMESNGEEGHIMVSETTKSMVDRSTEKVPFIFNKIKDVDLPKFNVCYAGYLVDKNPQFKVEEDESIIKKS